MTKKLFASAGWLSAVVTLLMTLTIGTASADALTGETYGSASAKISSWNAEAVVATVNGDQLPLDKCIVTSYTKASPRNASGQVTGSQYLVSLNCNAQVASPGKPGNSAASPAGREAKKDNTNAQAIADNPDLCNSENMSWCRSVCDKTGLCEVG